MKTSNTKCIYSLQLAGYLMLNHCRILRIEKNLGRSWRDVYLFENNKKIEELILRYQKEKSKENCHDDRQTLSG